MEDIFKCKVKEKQSRLVVRVSTSTWQDKNGLYSRKNIKFLKRKSLGFNMLLEEADSIGAEDVVASITNLNDVGDGVYEVIVCNEYREWESGLVEDWDYKLIPYEEE